MAAHVSKESPAGVEPAEARQALEKILKSKYFVNAHQKKRFLRLICDFHLKGRAHELNEYLLGYDVFGRDNDFNPSADPIVRVVAHEIRKKLELYYQNEGADDPVRLEIPAGSYQPVFTRHMPGPATDGIEGAASSPAPPEMAAGQKRLTPRTLALGMAALVLLAGVVILAISNWELRQRLGEANSSRDTAVYGAVWEPFLKDPAPPIVVLSNPPTLRFSKASDPEVIIRESIPLGPEAVEVLKNKFVTNPEVMIREANGSGAEGGREIVTVRQSGPPRLVLSTDFSTGMGEAIGLHYLTDLFRSVNRNIQLKRSRTLSADDLKNHNVILLGGVWVNEWSGKLSDNEDFVFSDHSTIVNRRPQPGEEREYIPQFDGRTGSLVVDYALITVKSNLSDANRVMVLAGVYSQGTEAAAECVTDKNHLDQLNQRLRQAAGQGSPPRYFQALLKVGVENGIPTTISILSLHELVSSGS
jgi:hypothetical protein